MSAFLPDTLTAIAGGVTSPLGFRAAGISAGIKASGKPDLALILGYPGTGKSRVVAELARQALRLGWRTLVVSPDAPAVDRVMESFASGPQRDKVLRWLGENESLSGVSASAAGLTLAARLHYYQHHTLASARRSASESRASAEHWGRLYQNGYGRWR